eukprot:510191-Rhodomonas_salina.6
MITRYQAGSARGWAHARQRPSVIRSYRLSTWCAIPGTDIIVHWGVLRRAMLGLFRTYAVHLGAAPVLEPWSPQVPRALPGPGAHVHRPLRVLRCAA